MNEKLKKIFIILLSVLLIFNISGCAKEIDYKTNLDKYVVNNIENKRDIVPLYRNGFTILQLTDLHWSTGTEIGNDNYGQVRYLKNLVKEAVKRSGKIDLIEITGDIFMLSNNYAVTSFIKTMEEIAIPYAVTWGNHDRQGKYNPNYLSNEFLNAKHCLYVEVESDNLKGLSNYVINLNENGETKWQIFNIDSGASYRSGAGDISLTYEYITQTQLEWLSLLHIKNVPSLAYYHIPQKDQEELFLKAKSGAEGYKAKFFIAENFAHSKVETAPSLEDAFVKNNVKGAFMGHDHKNDLTITTPNGIVYGYGVKTGKELYYLSVKQSELINGETVFNKNEFLDFTEDFDLIGASLVTLKDGGTFDLEHLYYNERANGDFVRWVKY